MSDPITSKTSHPSYVLITPVRDEAATIELTIESVVRQTVTPSEWVIVSDGSIDRTHEIVEAYARRYPWIRLIKRERTQVRSFATVVHNTEAGIRQLTFQDYEYLGLLDADVTFAHDYFEQLISRLENDPAIGLCGGVVYDIGTPMRPPRNREDIPGAVQFYTRKCFDSLGGLCPVPEGGWDALTCTTARMNGFRTTLFVDLVVQHLKPRNIAYGNPLRRKWQMGLRDYAIGYHPLFEFIKCLSRLTEPPLMGFLAWWAGYCSGPLRRRHRVVPPQVIAHLRSEQSHRLRRFFLRQRDAFALPLFHG
jgi:poly-beta-1,6-N-acetyl-D-glucosamine synthase